jgi:hypothetical protein
MGACFVAIATMLSIVSVAANAQQEPHPPWSLTGVTTPCFRQSTTSGSEETGTAGLKISAFLGEPSRTNSAAQKVLEFGLCQVGELVHPPLVGPGGIRIVPFNISQPLFKNGSTQLVLAWRVEFGKFLHIIVKGVILQLVPGGSARSKTKPCGE